MFLFLLRPIFRWIDKVGEVDSTPSWKVFPRHKPGIRETAGTVLQYDTGSEDDSGTNKNRQTKPERKGPSI